MAKCGKNTRTAFVYSPGMIVAQAGAGVSGKQDLPKRPWIKEETRDQCFWEQNSISFRPARRKRQEPGSFLPVFPSAIIRGVSCYKEVLMMLIRYAPEYMQTHRYRSSFLFSYVTLIHSTTLRT
jgi:hypothetical protein